MLFPNLPSRSNHIISRRVNLEKKFQDNTAFD